MGKNRSTAIAAALLLASVLVAARCPVPGQTSFVSGARSLALLDLATPVAVATVAGRSVATAPATREVAEGDIFRSLARGLLVQLNAHRGLQVIDVHDVAKPRILARLPVSGVPVELHVVGDVAYAILDASSGLGLYRQSSSTRGSVVLAVDLADPEHPAVIAMETVPGSATTTRLTRDGDRAALFVVASDLPQFAMPETAFGPIGIRFDIELAPGATHVRSFDVSGGGLALADELDLPGTATAVQATPELLMIARSLGSVGLGGPGSSVALIDIRDPAGVLVPGDEVEVAGEVRSQFQLDYQRGILRVFSHGAGDGGTQSHLQTFEASDASNAVPIDVADFGANETLYATLFLRDRAVAVTFRVVDPFHLFAIGDDGQITVGAEFQVSGWNDFFRPVFGDTRLLGVGVDDAAGGVLAVSLYDVTEIANAEPLLARAHVAQLASSEASFDRRAFSVLEDAVSVTAAGGAIETGLVLLPFTSWSPRGLVADVQIFTFSDHTLTRRGSMPHGSPVRRSFAADGEVVANLSEEELSLFDAGDPDAPAELGRLELAPDVTDVHRFGEHLVRIVNGGGGGARPTRVEVVAAEADPDLAEPITVVALPARTVVHRAGSLLVSVLSDPEANGSLESEIAIFDLADPVHPTETARLRTDRLSAAWFSGPLPPRDLHPARVAAIRFCEPCSFPLRTNVRGSGVVAVPDALVFLRRAWPSASLEVLDLGDPASPRFADRVVLADGIGESGLLADGRAVWIAAARHSHFDRRGRSFARHYAQRVDVSDPAAPIADEPVNVPGELVAVTGATLFTHDLQWERDVVEEGVVRLALDGEVARVEAVHWFPGRQVENVALDRAGHLLVAHTAAQPGFAMRFAVAPSDTELSVFDVGSAALALRAEAEVGDAAALLASLPGRALFGTTDALLVFNLEDPAAPFLQASFATPGPLGRVVIDGRSALGVSGRSGIQRFDLDAANAP